MRLPDESYQGTPDRMIEVSGLCAAHEARARRMADARVAMLIAVV
jgi:hypothetical protein